MKVKLIFGILAVLMVCAIFCISQGADRFYYGTWGPYDSFDFPCIKDSLKFNIAYDSNVNDTTIQEWVDHSLRAIVSNLGDQNSPYTWSAKSHYTLWEAEGYPGSYHHFTYNGGEWVTDDSASGGQARKFTAPGTPGLIQTGPNYYKQQAKRDTLFIQYTAEFQLKSPGSGGGPPQRVCSLAVTGSGQVLADSVLYDTSFTNWVGYRPFKIQYYATQNPIEFRIYWHGNRTLYVDCLKVYDLFGKELIVDKTHDQDIMDYVNQSWVKRILGNGDTVVYRWYLCDEPNYLDLFEPGRYIDSLIRTKSTERVGFQAFNQPGTILEGEYLLRQDPNEYSVDIYPTRWFAPDTSGERFQIGVDTLIMRLNQAQQAAISKGKDLWVTVQAHYFGYKTNRPDTCACCTTSFSASEVNYPGRYCYHYKRPPKPIEVRLQNFLALCYGAKSILNYCYYSYNSYQSVYHDTVLNLGLYNHIKNKTTDRWREIRDFTSPRVNVLGPVFNQLTWQGAGFHQNVATITGSFIDSLKPAPGETSTTTYVQVGFFKDDADTDYFMLVNRRCLSTEAQNVTVYIDSVKICNDIGSNKKMWYVIDQYSRDTTFTGAINGHIPFTTHLDPGEGKLFKLVPFAGSAFHGTAHPLIWQGGIMIDGDVTVDSTKTLVIQPPAKITFFANKDTLCLWDPDDCDFIVKGGLRAVGTETDSIIFTSTGTNPDDWEGIKVIETAESNTLMSYCVVDYAYTGIELKSPFPDTISHTSFHNNRMYGIIWWNDSQGLIAYNHILYDTACHMENFGVKLSRIRNGMSTSIFIHNKIINYYRGLYIEDCSTKVEYNTISNAGGYGICIGEQWLTSFPNYAILENIFLTGDLGDFGFYTYWNSGSVRLEHCFLLPNTNNGPTIGVIFQNNLAGSNIYFMRRCKVIDFKEKGIFCHWDTAPELGTENDKGYNRIYSVVDSAWYVYTGQKKMSSIYAQYNWWGEYPPDPTRFSNPVVYIPALEQEPHFIDDEPPDAKVAVSGEAPNRIELLHNYPNPFNPVTSIQFTVGRCQSPVHTTLKIYNILGQLVRTLLDEEKAEGSYTVYWDGRNDYGEMVSSGIYFYKLETGEFTDVKKMVLLR